jgi:shikimate kinase
MAGVAVVLETPKMGTVSGHNSIILIGPMKSGKTTVGKLLAERLGCSFVSLDSKDIRYMKAVGFDPSNISYSYRRQFFDEAVVRFLDEFEGVLELGGGHPIVPDPAKQARICKALEPFPNVVLLTPSPDSKVALQVLQQRRGDRQDSWGWLDWNKEFIESPVFYGLAKIVVFSSDRTPDETCEEILKKIHLDS